MNKFLIGIYIFVLSASISCKKFLDIVPDGIATIDNAFTTRFSAEKYLFTCYAYMPKQGDVTSNPALSAGEDFYCATSDVNNHAALAAVGQNIQLGRQNANSPYADAWTGYGALNTAGRSLYQGLSDCNIFLENIHKVPDMGDEEKERWIAEVKFLKAYYHFLLVRQYGPIYLAKENLPAGSSIADAKVFRNTLDECFEYIEQLMDEVLANENLPEFIANEAQELGRVTKGIALAFKAYVQVTAASPLFNGNTDYAHVVDKNGVAIFSPNKTEAERKARWEKAAATAKQAVEFLEAKGHTLYYFQELPLLSEETKTKLSIRGAVTENFNKEVVWGNPNCWIGANNTIARYTYPRGLVPGANANTIMGKMNVPLAFTLKFYTKNGIPIEEDNSYDLAGMYSIRTATAKEGYYIGEGYKTVGLNFDREPRYYADMVFDGNVWFGAGYLDESAPLVAMMKRNQTAGSIYASFHNLTGYTAKKLNHYKTVTPSGTSTATFVSYAWPVMRLADVYLLYAEALNESGGDASDVFEYVDKVRARAGLLGVQESWSTYSNNPSKPNTLAGRREIIQRERTIELAFEGIGYWDVRRWKTAMVELNKAISGWYVYGIREDEYYVPVTFVKPVFSMKDYFWPIPLNEMRKNPNLVQNPYY